MTTEPNKSEAPQDLPGDNQPKKINTEESNMRAWDRIVQTAIEKELVGTAGYKMVKHRPNDPIVNIQFLPQSRVRRTAVVACKAVRTYRNAILEQFKIDYKALAKQAIAQEQIIAESGMLDFNKKKEAEKLLFQIKVQIATLEAMETSLKNVNPAILTQDVPVDHPAAKTRSMIITPEEAKSL